MSGHLKGVGVGRGPVQRQVGANRPPEVGVADWLPRPLRAKTLLTNLSLDGASAYANTLQVCRLPLRRQLLHPDLAAGLDGHDPCALVRAAYAEARPNDPLGGMIAADVATLLPDDYLVKVDRASMANGSRCVRPCSTTNYSS